MFWEVSVAHTLNSLYLSESEPGTLNLDLFLIL